LWNNKCGQNYDDKHLKILGAVGLQLPKYLEIATEVAIIDNLDSQILVTTIVANN